MKECPNCHLINSDSALRCDCGYDFATGEIKESYLEMASSKPKQADTDIKCSKCGTFNSPDSEHCKKCGSRLGKSDDKWRQTPYRVRVLRNTLVTAISLAIIWPLIVFVGTIFPSGGREPVPGYEQRFIVLEIFSVILGAIMGFFGTRFAEERSVGHRILWVVASMVVTLLFSLPVLGLQVPAGNAPGDVVCAYIVFLGFVGMIVGYAHFHQLLS